MHASRQQEHVLISANRPYEKLVWLAELGMLLRPHRLALRSFAFPPVTPSPWTLCREKKHLKPHDIHQSPV